MIDTLHNSEEVSTLKASRLISRYGGGGIPHTKIPIFSLLHWYGFNVYELDEEMRGIELAVEKNEDEGLVISYNPDAQDLCKLLLYALALEDLDILPWNTVVKEYNWGSCFYPNERALAISYANKLANYCQL